MKDDLISREVAIEAVRELLLEPDSTQYIYSSDAIGAVKSVPSVAAVPLDKLCEMLCKSNVNVPCNDDCEGCEAFYGTGDTVNCWKVALTKWIEEQDAN